MGYRVVEWIRRGSTVLPMQRLIRCFEQPYLLSLGMSKSLLAFVWIAGPLSGTLVQPYVGIRSDNCRIKYGKRIPFMLSGALATAVSLLALAWTREIVHGFLGIFGANPESHGVQVCSITWAIAFVYILDFAINTGQCNMWRVHGTLLKIPKFKQVFVHL